MINNQNGYNDCTIYVLPVGIKVCLEGRSHKVFYFDKTIKPSYEGCMGHNEKKLLTPGGQGDNR